MSEQRTLSATLTSGQTLRNIAVSSGVELGWGVGMALVAMGPILTVFLSRLGASALVLGLAPALMQAGFAVMQLPVSHWTRRLRVTKYVLSAMHVLPCLMWSVGGLLIWRWAETRPTALIAALLALVLLFSLGISGAIPVWCELLPRILARRRGMGMGIVMAAGGIGGILGGLYATLALQGRPFPDSFAHLFVLAGLITAGATFLFIFVHEPPREACAPVGGLSLRGTLGELWRQDDRLRRYLLVRILWDVGLAATIFLAVYLLGRHPLPEAAPGGFVLATAVGAALIGPLLGHLGDRRGYRRVHGWGMGALGAGTLLALFTPPWGAYVVFLLVGVATAADGVGYVNLIVEMSGEHTRGYYQALLSTLQAPARLLAPLLWGALGEVTGLGTVLAASLVIQAVAFVLLLALVDDPRRPGQRLLRWPRGHLLPRLH